MIRTRRGSCHCGAVKYECDIDLSPPGERSEQIRPGPWFASTLRCNCTFCGKTRMWKNHTPAEAFRLLQGADRLTSYRFGEGTIDHTFCKVCGVYPFVNASMELLGGDFYCVNIATLDDVTPEEFAAAPIVYEDGINDDWTRSPKVTSYL
ncbi:GFA family protein [Brevundimonas sp.]|uniref:GFA family protein n=1 Tax=Brevundimonas sp. TaxID=1871086 RepID=UPI002CA679A8|nr:GFA family protein [Brevundimonas sp.]HWQ86582.1 GFA family protein [Brevundimonas sp.]